MGALGGVRLRSSVINCPPRFSQPRNGHGSKLGPSICQADLMKMEMVFSRRQCLQRSQPEWKKDRAAERQGTLGDSAGLG